LTCKNTDAGRQQAVASRPVGSFDGLICGPRAVPPPNNSRCCCPWSRAPRTGVNGGVHAAEACTPTVHARPRPPARSSGRTRADPPKLLRQDWSRKILFDLWR
jgi:hypothetical protein